MRSSTIRCSARRQELRSSRAQNGFSTQSINNRKRSIMEIKRLRLTDLEINRGQVPGLPSNPRQWSRGDLDKLIQSIKDTPELLEARGPIVWPYEGKYIILGGNMRFSALREIGVPDVKCIVMPEDMPIAKLREIVVLDNGQFGSWDYDMLANEWEDLPLCEMGVPAWETEVDPEEVSEPKKNDGKDLSKEIESSFRVEICCENEAEQEKLYNELIGRGLECRILTL